MSRSDAQAEMSAFARTLPRATQVGNYKRYGLAEYAIHVLARSQQFAVLERLIAQAENPTDSVSLISAYLHNAQLPATEQDDVVVPFKR